MSDNLTVYISIGNSNDKLSQREWANFVSWVDASLENLAAKMHGRWLSVPDAEYQNAAWCVDVRAVMVSPLKAKLRRVARKFRQESIAWAEVPAVEFLEPTDER